MGITFLSWSTPLSLGLIIMLGGLVPHLSSTGLLRIGAVALSLPALICSIIILKITMFDSSIVTFPLLYQAIPIDFGIYLTSTNAILIACSMFSFTIVIFCLPTTNLGNNLVFLGITYATLIIPQYFKNLFIGISMYSAGSLVVTYFSILYYNKKLSTTKITADFMQHTIGNILAFISLLLILINQKTILINNLLSYSAEIPSYYSGLFFAAMFLRILNLPAANDHSFLIDHSGFNNYFLGRIYTGLGALLFLLRCREVIFNSDILDNTYLIASLLILLHALFYLITHKNLVHIANSICYLFSAIALYLLCLKQFHLAEYLIYALIFTTPIIILVSSRHKYASRKKSANIGIQVDPLIIIGRLTQALANFGANISANFVSIIYANFLFYRLPQLIITIFQVPLRVFHSGSLQRSVLFIAFLITSYYWLWG